MVSGRKEKMILVKGFSFGYLNSFDTLTTLSQIEVPGPLEPLIEDFIMKSCRKELWFNVPSRRAFINITPQVEECLKESGIKEGLVPINMM